MGPCRNRLIGQVFKIMIFDLIKCNFRQHFPKIMRYVCNFFKLSNFNELIPGWPILLISLIKVLRLVEYDKVLYNSIYLFYNLDIL